MPIKPENRHRYPANWKDIRQQILARARHRCEECDLLNHTIGYRHKGEFIHMPRALRESGAKVGDIIKCADGSQIKIIKIVLTIAHLDHTPENCDPSNLKALCQRCHLAYDAEHHARNAAATRRNRLAVADLFEVPA